MARTFEIMARTFDQSFLYFSWFYIYLLRLGHEFRLILLFSAFIFVVLFSALVSALAKTDLILF